MEDKKLNAIEAEENNFVQYSKSTAKTFLLMMKNHFRSSSFYLGNLIMPIVITLMLGNLFPINYSFIWILFISTTFAGFSSYGTLLFAIRKSTIKKNFDMTATESSSLYSAMFIMLVFVILITVGIIFISILTFDGFNLLSHDWTFPTETSDIEKHIDWKYVDYVMIDHYMFMSAIILFSLCFFFEQLLATQRNFFIASFIYLLAGILFSGTWSCSIYISSTTGKAGIIHVSDMSKLGEGEYEYVEVAGIMPSYMAGAIPWWIGQFLPHYGLNQLAYNSLNQAWASSDPSIVSSDNPVGLLNPEYTQLSPTMFTHMGDKGVLQYTLLPIIEILLLLFVGSYLARYKDKK